MCPNISPLRELQVPLHELESGRVSRTGGANSRELEAPPPRELENGRVSSALQLPLSGANYTPN
jgi:hypothetical protein